MRDRDPPSIRTCIPGPSRHRQSLPVAASGRIDRGIPVLLVIIIFFVLQIGIVGVEELHVCALPILFRV